MIAVRFGDQSEAIWSWRRQCAIISVNYYFIMTNTFLHSMNHIQLSLSVNVRLTQINLPIYSALSWVMKIKNFTTLTPRCYCVPIRRDGSAILLLQCVTNKWWQCCIALTVHVPKVMAVLKIVTHWWLNSWYLQLNKTIHE